MNSINSYPIVYQEVAPSPSDLENQRPFIVANTREVTLDHLRQDCIIPVFSKDNETTISHYQFIEQVVKGIQKVFPNASLSAPQIRISHVVKGRTPSAIGKPAVELTEAEKTIYYERCAFLFQLSGHGCVIDGNVLNLSVGGVRAYNQENLYSRKSLEKFKIFIGYRNQVCMNLCVSTDGFSDQLRVGSPSELFEASQGLLASYSAQEHRKELELLESVEISEEQFAHLVGKLRMYTHLSKVEKADLAEVDFNDSQINQVVRDYYACDHFGRDTEGTITLWSLYNLFTQAIKSSYIDRFLDRGVHAYELVKVLGISAENGQSNWFLNN